MPAALAGSTQQKRACVRHDRKAQLQPAQVGAGGRQRSQLVVADNRAQANLERCKEGAVQAHVGQQAAIQAPPSLRLKPCFS